MKAVVAVTLVALAAASPAAADPVTGFHTPAWAAQCVVDVRADASRNTLTCWTPNDGFYVRVTPQGRVAKGYARRYRGLRDTYWADGLLSYGENWKHISPGFFQFACQSRRNGLTCTNHEGHGWWLGRSRGYRIY